MGGAEEVWTVPDGPVYLPAADAASCPYCFDPGSAALRRALRQPRPRAGTLLPSAALAADLEWVRGLLRRQYAGYMDWIRHPALDVEAAFRAWGRGLRRGGATRTFREGVVEPLLSLRTAVPDRHLTVWGADPLLDADARAAWHEYQAPLGDGGASHWL